MRYAVDRYILGHEQEVEAKSFLPLLHIPGGKDCFFCPECGEPVFFCASSKGHFSHRNRTEGTPECDKRVDGRSGLSLYERVGLSPYIVHDIGEQYRLGISFPPLGRQTLDSAVRQKTYIQISANGQVYHTFQVNYTLFSPDCSTLLPINFLPPVGGNYAIEVKNAAGIASIKQKWAPYADGFEVGGALFHYREEGGKKIRRGDSISPGKQYYVVTEQRYSPYYPEIQVARIGSIRLKNKDLIVSRLSVSISTKDATRYSLVNGHLKRMFGVWLLETPPELTTLWPPTVLQQDMQVPATLSTKKLYCAVSSGNNTPNVYYFETSTSQPNQQTAVGDSVAFSFFGQELAASVDRKYVGREAFYRRISLPSRNFSYEVNLEDSNGVRLDLENLTQTSLEWVSFIKANAKMELVVRCKGNLYQHVAIKSDNISMPSLKYPEAIYLVIEGGIFFSYHTNEPIMVAQLDEVYILADLKKRRQGPMVPAPTWVAWIVKNCCQKGNLSLARYICDEISGGKIPLGVLKALLVVKKVMIGEGSK